MNAKSRDDGVVQKIRNSHIDIAVVEGEGDDVFLKAGGDVLLVDEMEARTLAKEIVEKLEGDR